MRDWLNEIAGERVLRLGAGETVFRQGDSVFAVFRVTSGRIRLVRNLEDGSSVALHTARATDTFAEAAISADAYHCDGVAETIAEAVAYPIEPLRRRLSEDPEAALSFAMFMAAQVRDLRGRLELRNIRSAPERLRAWLQMKATGAPLVVTLDQPWTEVAAEIGLSREALYRALSDLSRAGIIRRDPSCTVLLKPPSTRSRR